MRTPAPCPICKAPYGFHDDEPHDTRLPGWCRIPTAKQRRAARNAEKAAAYAAWLATQEPAEVNS